MNATVQCWSTPEDAAFNVVVTFVGPLGLRGWTEWHQNEQEAWAQVRAARIAAAKVREAACCLPLFRPHGRMSLRLEAESNKKEKQS